MYQQSCGSVSVLGDDWFDYKIRKTRNSQSYEYFDPTAQWEVNYLVGKVCKHFPFTNIERIQKAIAVCSRTVAAPYKLDVFVAELVGIIDNRN